MRSLLIIMLAAAMLPALGHAQTVNICDRTQQVRDEIMREIDGEDCAAVDSEELAGIEELYLSGNGIMALAAGDFDGLTSLTGLWLHDNQLTALPEAVFDGLISLTGLSLYGNQLTALPEGVFDSLISLTGLSLYGNQLTALPEAVFESLTGLQRLYLDRNRLRDLPDGVFDSLTSLTNLWLYGNQLTALPEGVFDGLTSLSQLRLQENRLAVLPEGVFDSLTSLFLLFLDSNQLTALPPGVFDSLTNLEFLSLSDNRLTALPEGVFDGLTSLQELYLHNNHLVGLTSNDPLFAGLPSLVTVSLHGQTEPPEQPEEPAQPATHLAAAVPLMVSASDSMRQGFVRVINESDESGSVRILAFDDGGTAAKPIEIQLGASETRHFNAGDLENGNAGKGINAGIGRPVQGDWRLDIETALDVRVLAYVRTNDGFLTAMHDVLPRDAQGRIVAQTFNPGSNDRQVSKLRLVNTGANAEGVSIEGVDDRGNAAGPVTLTLASGASRTLSALDLEEGAQGLNGSLGDGAGKWRLFITAGQSVVGVSLLESASGHLTNLSTMGAP